MKTISVPEQEFLQLQYTVSELQKALAAVQAQLQTFTKYFMEKNAPPQPEPSSELAPEKRKLPLKFGAGKGIVTYMADDFTAPLEDMKEYME